MSRNERDWTAKFPAVAEGVARLPVRTAMLDGEVAVFLPDGTTSFQALQNAASGEDTGGRLTYMVFDLLHLDGWDVTGARLEDRKALLARLLKASPVDPLKYSDHVAGAGPEFFAQACRLGLEGIVSKRRDALYHSARTPDWLKIKCIQRAGGRDRRLYRSRGLARRHRGLAGRGVRGRAAGLRGQGRHGVLRQDAAGIAQATPGARTGRLSLHAAPHRPRTAALGEALAGRAGEVRRVDGRRSDAASVVRGAPRGQAAGGGRARDADTGQGLAVAITREAVRTGEGARPREAARGRQPWRPQR